MLKCLNTLFIGDLKPLATPVVCQIDNYDSDMNLDELASSMPKLLVQYKQLHYSNSTSDENTIALVSAWSLDYLWKVLPSFIVATSVLKILLPLAPENIEIRINNLGTVKDIKLPNEGLVNPNSSTQERYNPLINDHLTPLFDELNKNFKVPKKILWGNALRYIKNIFNTLEQQYPTLTYLKLDREILLTKKFFDDGSFNPLYFPIRKVIKDNEYHQAHNQCCLYYQLPNFSYCDLCPRQKT